ncbi:hypothetical protein NKH77_01120 [Streptomyces sp. M19]
MTVSSPGAESRTARTTGVQSVARAAALLGPSWTARGRGHPHRAVEDHQVEREHRAPAARHVERGGLLCRSDEGDRFQPGPVLLRLGRRSLAASGLPEVTAVLKELADGTGETASIGMRRGESVLVLVAVQSEQPLRYLGEPGRPCR